MQNSGLWQAVLGEIELSVSHGNFVTWFKNTELVRNKDGVLVVGVPNIFVKNQLERKFNELVVGVLAKNGVKPERVEYKIHTGIAAQARSSEASSAKDAGGLQLEAVAARPQRTISNVTHSYRQGLNERYSFENFVVGSGN